MDSKNSFLTTPMAIIIGSTLICITILISNGNLKISPAASSLGAKKIEVTPSPANLNPVIAGAKVETDIVKNLKNLASKIDLDQQKFDSCLDSGEKAAQVKTDLDDGIKVGVQGTPALFINGKPVFKGAAPFEDYKGDLEEALKGSIPSADKKDVGVGSLPALGNPEAPVTIIEFSDFQCPYCARLFTGAEAQIKKEYVDTGKVKIYFRDYPLTQIHQGAQKAAEAARCANDQSKFWQMHDEIFNNQSSIF